MKPFKLIILGMVLFLSNGLKAQVSVNVNIGSPPQWGPIGYTEERYYYLPDVEAYYDVRSSMFIYYGDGVWIHRASLPSRYRSYDLYSGYKVVMVGYRGDSPYNNFKEYKVKYKRGYHGGDQKTIGNKPGKGNSRSPEHSEGSNKQENHGNDKSMKKDHGHGGGHGKK